MPTIAIHHTRYLNRLRLLQALALRIDQTSDEVLLLLFI